MAYSPCVGVDIVWRETVVVKFNNDFSNNISNDDQIVSGNVEDMLLVSLIHT